MIGVYCRGDIAVLIYIQMIASDEDKSKFEQIYLTYRKLMFFVARSILKNDADAEDAVHTAFVSIIEHLKKISEINCPETKAFAVIVAECKALDILRSKKYMADTDFCEATAGFEIELPGDGGLSDAISKLPARYREVILLRYAYGYSTKELGKMLGHSQGTVQKLIWRAKMALQKQLKEIGETI